MNQNHVPSLVFNQSKKEVIMNRHQENCASILSLNHLKEVIMNCHKISPKINFFLQSLRKYLFLKHVFSKKFFALIFLAAFSTACNVSLEEDEEDLSKPSSQVSDSTCTIKQFQDESGKTQAIAAMKDFDVGQTLTFFYDCNIAKKDYNKVLELEYDDKAIEPSITEIDIPAQAKATGSFTVKALKTGKTNVKISLEKSKELALTIIPTFTLDKTKVKIEELTTTGLTALKSNSPRKLEVYQDKLYLLSDATSGNLVKFYSSSDGTTWKDLGIAQDATDTSKKIAGWFFDTTVHNGKLWVIGSSEGQKHSFWNFDGKNWKRVETGKIADYSSLVSFRNVLYQVAGSKKIYAYENSQWNEKHTFTNVFNKIDTVIFNNKLWIIGGLVSDRSVIRTVSTFDGTNYTKVTDLPQENNHNAVEVFPRGLLVIGGKKVRHGPFYQNTLFWSRFGKKWTEITGIKNQDKLGKTGRAGVTSGATVVWKGALWATSLFSQKILKITYTE